MSASPPTKPPRGVKQGKETSGLLMSVIRTLSASETNEQREKERAKLEKEYKKSDARLDELVAAHANEITEVMQKFSAVGAALSAWGQHSAAAEARLAACRALLRVRRDDLRRLWADARTHHHALRMLTDIERVVVSEREARELTARGRVVGAAHALRAALATARDLMHVRALSATAHHLEAKKTELVDIIVRKLNDAVYRDERAPLSRSMSARRRTALVLAELTKSAELTEARLQDMTAEWEAAHGDAPPDAPFDARALPPLAALAALGHLDAATEKFKVQIQDELLEVIDSVSRRIIDDEVDEVEGEEEYDALELEEEGEGSGRAFARLVACLADEFKACGLRQKRLIQLWRAALQRDRQSDAGLHTEQHYWSAVQQVMQLLLTEYLQIESVSLSAARRGAGRADARAPPLRLADYFARRRPPRRQCRLFRLDAAAPAPAGAARKQRYPLVCAPRPALLHAALPALHDLCAHLERPGGGECSLRAFVADYVRWGESERLAARARARVLHAAADPGAWRERALAGGAAGAGDRRAVCACALAAAGAMRAGARAAARAGSCGGAALARAAAAALAALAEQAAAAHARAQPTPPARAAKWLADDDIVRFLQALPNYRTLQRPLDAPPTSEV